MQPRPQGILPPRLKVGENGPGISWSHDTQNFWVVSTRQFFLGCFDTTIYVRLNFCCLFTNNKCEVMICQLIHLKTLF
jgi:hypothetical protein